jgi:NTE family protein
MAERESIGLVLAGGGARGAYEVGALSVILPILEERGERPTILAGTSVGAINAAFVASSGHVPVDEAMEAGLAAWRDVDKGDVIGPVVLKQAPLAALRYLGDALSLPGGKLSGLLDPSPLGENLREWIDWPALHSNVEQGTVDAVAVVATSTHTGRTVVFYESTKELTFHCSRAVDYVAAGLAPEHIRASAAIPVVFPPVRVDEPVDARGWYIDGGTRFNAPIKPAIDIGAERLLVVGTTALTPRLVRSADPDPDCEPDLTDAALQLVHGALVDPLVEDIRMLSNINEFYVDGDGARGARALREAAGKDPYRLIPYAWVGPSRPDAIGELACEVFRSRYGGLKSLRSVDFGLLNAIIDAESTNHGELLSYLFFDAEFIEELIAMGRRDGQAWVDRTVANDSFWSTTAFPTPVEAEMISATET